MKALKKIFVVASVFTATALSADVSAMRISSTVTERAGRTHETKEFAEKPTRAPAAAPAPRSAPTPAPRSAPTPAPRSEADKAIEKAEKASDRYTEVRSRPHTSEEHGKAFKEMIEAKKAAEEQLAKP